MLILTLTLGLWMSLSSFAASQKTSATAVQQSEKSRFAVELLFQQKDVIWGFDFLQDGRVIFTERGGAIRIWDPKRKAVVNVTGAPTVWAKGQGGMLDIRVHPTNKSKVYWTYSQPHSEGRATTALSMADLRDGKLENVKILFSAAEPNGNKIHFGSRIEFDGQGHVFVSVGDRDERERAQELSSHQGKVVRLKEDGGVPSDNPFVGTKGAKPEIWSLGHRNPQGMVFDSRSKKLWLAEMGPRGGDEVNLVRKGLNYGWPVITYGREYWGPKIGEGTQKKGLEQPVIYWVPSISPSGIALYQGKAFSGWTGNLFLGNLGGTHLRRLVFEEDKVVHQEILLKDLGMRIRCVHEGPDGFLYLSTDDGRFIRLMPVP